MAETSDGDNLTPLRVGDGPNYKSLFMGACSLLVLVTGGLWGLWNRSTQDEADRSRAANRQQWERITALENAVLGNTGKTAWLERDITDHEQRIRALERIRR